MKRNQPIVIGGLFVATAVVVGCKAHSAEKPPTPVKAKSVETISSTGGVRYSASISARTQVDLAFKVGGYVDAIHQIRGYDGRLRNVQEGDLVSKGTVLARVRQSDFLVKVGQAESQAAQTKSSFDSSKDQVAEAQSSVQASKAQLAQAEASLARARLDYDRAKKLFESQSMTRADYDAAKAQNDVAEAQVNAAISQVSVAEARANVAKFQVEAVGAQVKGAQAALQGARIPLQQVSTISYGAETEKLRRKNQFRTITVSCLSEEGVLPSEVLNAARSRINEIAGTLPPGYRLQIEGEEKDQVKSFKELTLVMGVSIAMIFLALVFQFKHAIKPFVVFAAIPYGMVGAIAALWIMGAPFGFMAFLGIVSLVGVIVSHIIVLFDFIEEKHAEGEPLREALLDAGIMRLRPVLITVGATVIALFPLASHGGPLWEPLCYAQIGGLIVATFITLLLVPVIYAIFVLDLKTVKWETVAEEAPKVHLAAGA